MSETFAEFASANLVESCRLIKFTLELASFSSA